MVRNHAISLNQMNGWKTQRNSDDGRFNEKASRFCEHECGESLVFTPAAAQCVLVHNQCQRIDGLFRRVSGKVPYF